MIVDLPTAPEDVADLWNELLDLAEQSPVPWVLIGAQMVALHAWRAATEAPRLSRDGDVLVNVRGEPRGTELLAKHLEERGFELEGPNRMGLGHEFRRGGVAIDILAPDNLGPRASIQTLHQARTVSVPGGTQALTRVETVGVRLGRRRGGIPIPDLHGAIILKAEAISVDDVPEAQRQDVGLLLSLVPDREALKAQLTSSDRKVLRRYPEFADPASSLYRAITGAREAAATYRRLIG
jgi:hypothetical protein